MNEYIKQPKYIDGNDSYVKNTWNIKNAKSYLGTQLLSIIQMCICTIIIISILTLKGLNLSVFERVKTWYVYNINDSLLIGNSIDDYKNAIHTLSYKIKNSYNNFSFESNDFYKKLLLSTQPSSPLSKGTVTSKFGIRDDDSKDGKNFHYGIDIAAEPNQEIYSIMPGIVEKAEESKSYGNYIIINHGKGIKSLYAHCNDLTVSKDDSVKYGDLIAHVGNTGESTGAHLHLELIIDGKRKDPYFIIKDMDINEI